MNFLEEHLNEIMDYLNEDCSATIIGITDKPEGIKQETDWDLIKEEYIIQHTGDYEDDYYGTKYLPLPSGKYLKTSYCC